MATPVSVVGLRPLPRPPRGRLVAVTTGADVAEEGMLDPGARWPIAVSAVVGAFLGALGRNVPVVIALQSGAGTSEARSCGMEEAAECAVEHLPAALGALLILGVAMVVVSGLMALGGVALVVVGVIRHRRGSRGWLPSLAVTAGTALTVPALWLLASFLHALAT